MESASPITRWMLEPSVVHLNHGSFGGCLRSVFEAAHQVRQKLEAAPMQWILTEWQPALDAARAALAAFVRAPLERLAFVPNATTGVAVALASANLAAGDRVIVTDHGYNAVRNQLHRLAAARGLEVHVVQVPLPFDGDALVDAIAAAITPKTHLAILDHITSPSALRLPLERILPKLREHDVAVIVDGAHAPGQIPLDVSALLDLGATFYAGNNHKWLCAPKSSGFLVAAPDVPIVPVVQSHAWGENRMHAELDWAGTHDPAVHLVVPRAIEALAAEAPWPTIFARNHALALAMRERLCDVLHSQRLAPDDAIGTMASVAVDVENPMAVEKQLLLDGIEVVLNHAPGGPLLRVSAHLYNQLAEVDVLATKLIALGVRGR